MDIASINSVGCSNDDILSVDKLHMNYLARPYRRPEDVVVQAIVIPELELSHIEREIIPANLVEHPDHAPLNRGCGTALVF